jgi:hypothetical protein
MEPLDFLDAPEGVTDAVQPVVEAQNEPPPAPEAEPAPQPAPEPVAPPPTPEPGFVPFAAVLDERDKRKAAEERLRTLEAQAQARLEPAADPDPYEDPQGYKDLVASQVQQARWDAITSTSMVMAEEKYGAETVKSASEAFIAEAQSKPWLFAELQRQPHPYNWVVQRHQRETAFAKLDPSQVDAFLAWQQQALSAPAPIQPAAPAAPKPPVSLASAPAAGGGKPGQAPVGPGEAFNTVFGG